jgi:transmembrane sensor
MKDSDVDRLFREKVDQLSGLPENISWNEEEGWIQYREQFHKGRPGRISIVISFMSVAAVFAIALYTLILNPYSKNKTVIEQNTTAEVRQVSLPDGNRIWLNTNSSIEYQSKINSKNFELNITGEIYIEIDKTEAEQYILKANNAVVVTGKTASVNIKAYPEKENIEIEVTKGAVKVFGEGSPKGLALLVTEGNYCSVHKSQKLIYASTIINNNYLAWKTGKLIFDDQPIATVIDILSEYYNTTIEISDKSVAFCMFTGSFEKPTLSNILTKIQKDLNLEIRYTGTKITISGIGC